MQGCAAGRCRVARRAEVAIRAGTAISLRRIVGVEEPDCFRTVNLLGLGHLILSNPVLRGFVWGDVPERGVESFLVVP